MHLPMYASGRSNPSPGNGPPDQKHLQQNHSHSHGAPQVQQGYIYPPPPPASSQQYHSHLPPVSVLPPPPPLPPGSMPPSQAFPHPFHPPSFPLSFPLKSLEPPGMPLPPPPPPSTSPLFADLPEAAKKVCESVSLNGRALDIEGPVVEDAGSLKGSSIRCGGESSSSPLEKKAEHGSPLYDDPDIEMEDDITLPETESYPSQPLNYGSDQLHRAYSNTEQHPPQPVSAETNTPLTGTAMSFETNLPVSKLHQEVDDGSRQASSSPYSGRAKIVPVGGDMYDPFVDSFEPASVKLDCVQEHEPVSDSYALPKEASISSNSPLNVEENNQGVVDKQALSECEFDTTARVSVSSNKPPDVEENTTGNNDIGAVVSGDNDEFGENGRETNSHETLTPNSNNEISKVHDSNAREADSTRKKSRGDAKEKDSSSRSMKLFQVALTKFVKDLLKPSWRQGNMSKEAFKTIVKRAVDKVSNSMEGRRVPKSKAKIDKYIDSSRDKLTKLVMGYVDKYVKA